MKNPITDYYEVEVHIDITEKNQYHDSLSEGLVRSSFKTKVKDLGDIGEMLQRIKNAVEPNS